jgi:hypothetical protein
VTFNPISPMLGRAPLIPPLSRQLLDLKKGIGNNADTGAHGNGGETLATATATTTATATATAPTHHSAATAAVALRS